MTMPLSLRKILDCHAISHPCTCRSRCLTLDTAVSRVSDRTVAPRRASWEWCFCLGSAVRIASRLVVLPTHGQWWSRKEGMKVVRLCDPACETAWSARGPALGVRARRPGVPLYRCSRPHHLLWAPQHYQ